MGVDVGRENTKTGKTYIWERLFTSFIFHIEDPGWQIYSLLSAATDFLSLFATSSAPASVLPSSSNNDNGNKALAAAVLNSSFFFFYDKILFCPAGLKLTI